MAVVAVVIDHQHGVDAYIMVLYPSTQHGVKSIVDMRCEGCFLDLVVGALILPFSQEFKSRKVDAVSGEVVTLEDDFNFIKMDIQGPDI